MREANASIAKERGNAAKPTRAMVIPPGEVKAIPAAAAEATGSARYLKLISVKMRVIMTRGARRSTAEMSQGPMALVSAG